MAETRGIRKVSENILAPGRAMIVTEKDKDKYNWDEIPDGSIFIDTETGIQAVKLHGESDWVPAGIKNDGTINIAKDNISKVESFTIVQETVPDNPNEFIYTNSEGQQRHGLKEWNAAGTVLKGYVFTLEQGTYIMHRNHLRVTIDDLLQRSVATGGVEEVSEKRFRLTEQLVDKMEITVEYSAAFRMGSPYPRFFMNGEAPEASEVGDFWLDTDATLEESGPIKDEDIEDNRKIGWDRIENHPTTLDGYGITDKISREDHVHNIKDIVDFPDSLPANGGHADTADTAIQSGYAKRADVTSMSNMAINDGANRNIVATYMTKDGEGATGTWNIDITGSADSARKATYDGFGREIATTYLTEQGGTLYGKLNFPSGQMNNIGDDVSFGSINQGGVLAIKGLNAPTSLAIVRRGSEKDAAKLTYDGGKLVCNKVIDASILGNAATASHVEWADVLNKPDFEKIMGEKAKRSLTSEHIENGKTSMSIKWQQKNTAPQYLWGSDDAANAYIYKASSLNVQHAQKADTATLFNGRTAGNSAGQIPMVQEDGRISRAIIPDHTHKAAEIWDPENLFIFGTKAPLSPKENAIWFDINELKIKVNIGGKWKEFRSGAHGYDDEQSGLSNERAIGIALTNPGHITGIWTRINDKDEGYIDVNPGTNPGKKPDTPAVDPEAQRKAEEEKRRKEEEYQKQLAYEKMVSNLHITINATIQTKRVMVSMVDQNGRDHMVGHQYATGFKISMKIGNYKGTFKDLGLKTSSGAVLTSDTISIDRTNSGYDDDMSEYGRQEVDRTEPKWWNYTGTGSYLNPNANRDRYSADDNYSGHPFNTLWMGAIMVEIYSKYPFVKDYASYGESGNAKLFIHSFSMNYNNGINYQRVW